MRKITKKLHLDREAIRHLAGHELRDARGGLAIDTWTNPVATDECVTYTCLSEQRTNCDPPPPPP